MLALTCDTCGRPATVFFMNGETQCNDHGKFYATPRDFPQPESSLGEEMLYNHLDRYLGLFTRL